MTDPIMKAVHGDGVKINVALWEGGGKPVLCVHGITANCRSWDVLAAALAPEHRVLAMDLRGRGQSDRPPEGYSIEHHTRDILCLLDDLGIQRAVIMGHSLGAFIGLVLGAEHPDRVDRLILVDGGGDLSREQMNNVFDGIKPALDRLEMVFPSAEAYLDKMREPPYIHPWSSAIERYYRYEIEPTEDGVRTNIDPRHIQEEQANIRKLNCAPFYSRIKCKVLILRAPKGLLSLNDLLLPEDVIDKMIRKIGDAKRFDVADTNHYGVVFQPHAARDRAIREFLED